MKNPANKDRNSPYLLKVSEAIAILNLSPAKVYKMVKCGDIPVIKFGRSIRIPYSALIDLIYGKIENE